MENNIFTKEQANARLEEVLKEAKSKIKEAEKLAEQYGLTFASPIQEYGMGGWYRSEKFLKEENEKYGEGSWDLENDVGWITSSSNC